jgi:hypothetical protein
MTSEIGTGYYYMDMDRLLSFKSYECVMALMYFSYFHTFPIQRLQYHTFIIIIYSAADKNMAVIKYLSES